MANLKYRGTTVTPPTPGSTTAPGLALTNDEIDGNFKSLNDDILTRAPLASPGLTGTPTAPTAAAGTNTTQIATTAHVFAERSNTATLTNKTLTGPSISNPIVTGTLSAVDITVSGNLTVNGTTTTINSTTVAVDDINIELGAVAAPTDATANGGGITLLGTTNKTITWDSPNTNWTSSEHWNLLTGKSYKINNTVVLSSTGLGTGITSSSLTSVGTLTGGTWNATAIGATYGGTGQTTYGVGDILYASTTSALSKLADVATGNVLISGGVGVAPSYGKVGLTTHISGTLAVGNGGTGTTLAPTAGGLIYGASTSAYGSTAAGTTYQLAQSNGASAPTWANFDLSLHAPDSSYKKIVRLATTADLNASTFSANVLSGYTNAQTLALTTTAASTSITTTSTAGLLVGAVTNAATVQVAAGTTVASITGATTFTVNNRAAITTTTITGNGTTATATFSAQTYAPYAVGATIVISGATPSTYNGSKVVTACTTTSVSWSSTETVTATVQGSIAFTIAAGTSISTNFTQTIAALSVDGIAVAVNDRILVKDQTLLGSIGATDTAKYNGIYYVSAIGSTSVPWTLTRAVDADASADIDGAIVNVSIGTVNGGKAFKTYFTGTSTLNTTPMYWNRIVDASASALVSTPTTAVGVDIATDTKTQTLVTGNVADLAINSLGVTTVKSVAASTYTRGSTLYIAGAPVASTNATITTPYALYVAGGASYFGGTSTLVGAVTVNSTINGLTLTSTSLSSASATNLTINTGTTGVLSLDSGSTGAINIGTNANAKTITIGNNTGATGIVFNSGSAGVTFNQPATSMFKVAATAAPTVDMVQITNAGFGVATAGVNCLDVTYVAGAAAVEAGAMRVNITPSATASNITNGIRFVMGNTSASTTNNAIKFDNLTTSGGSDRMIYAGTGWDDILNYNGTQIISGTGGVIAGQLSGTIPSAVLGASSLFVGTTSVALNRASAALALTGITSVSSATGLDLTSSGANAVTIDSSTTGAINIGTNANAKTITIGNATGATGVNINTGTGGTIHTVTGAVTNSVSNNIRLSHQTSGTPAAGIGIGIQFEQETSAGNTEIGMRLKTVTTDVTAASEDFDFVVDLMAGGATAAEKFRVTSAGALGLSGANYGTVGQSLISGGPSAPATWGVVGATLSAVSASTTYYIGLSGGTSGPWTDARTDSSNLFYTSGNQTLYSTNFNTSSDRNLKDNIKRIENALSIVQKLDGVSFDWKHNGEKSYGVIAQNIEEHLPELVSEIDGKKTVNYNGLIGVLIEAVKELAEVMK